MTKEELQDKVLEEIGENKAIALVVDLIKSGQREMAKRYSADCLEMQFLNACAEDMIEVVTQIEDEED